jgi:hypothetical protein
MLQLQSLANHAHRILVQPVQVGLIAQPWQRTRPQGLCYVSTFRTTLVKKSQQANRASELRRISLPRTRVNKGAKRREQDQSANVDAYRTAGLWTALA